MSQNLRTQTIILLCGKELLGVKVMAIEIRSAYKM